MCCKHQWSEKNETLNLVIFYTILFSLNGLECSVRALAQMVEREAERHAAELIEQLDTIPDHNDARYAALFDTTSSQSAQIILGRGVLANTMIS